MIRNLRRAALFALPGLLTMAIIDPQNAASVGGVTLSGEKLATALILGCNFLLAWSPRRRRLPALDPSLIVAGALCLLVIAGGAAWSLQMGPATFLLRDVSMYVFKLALLVIPFWSVGDEADVRWLCRGVMLLPLVTMAQIAQQLREGFSIFEIYAGEDLGRTTLANQNLTALTLLIGGVSCFAFRRICFSSPGMRRASVFVGAASLSLVLFTLSRSGMLAIAYVVGSTVVAPSQVRRGWFGMAVALGVGAILLWATAGASTILERFATLSFDNPVAGESRVLIWPAAVQALKDSPVMGLGIGQYRWLISLQVSTFFIAMHSTYLLLYADLGVFGFVAYGALAAAFLRVLRRMKRSGDESCADIALGMGQILAVTLIFGIGHDVHLLNLPWLVLGIGPAAWRVFNARPVGTPIAPAERHPATGVSGVAVSTAGA